MLLIEIIYIEIIIIVIKMSISEENKPCPIKEIHPDAYQPERPGVTTTKPCSPPPLSPELCEKFKKLLGIKVDSDEEDGIRDLESNHSNGLTLLTSFAIILLVI